MTSLWLKLFSWRCPEKQQCSWCLEQVMEVGIHQRKEEAIIAVFLCSSAAQVLGLSLSPVIGGVRVDADGGVDYQAWPVSSSAHD